MTRTRVLLVDDEEKYLAALVKRLELRIAELNETVRNR